jgi:hypothetical protein
MAINQSSSKSMCTGFENTVGALLEKLQGACVAGCSVSSLHSLADEFSRRVLQTPIQNDGKYVCVHVVIEESTPVLTKLGHQIIDDFRAELSFLRCLKVTPPGKVIVFEVEVEVEIDVPHNESDQRINQRAALIVEFGKIILKGLEGHIPQTGHE